jgi:hypothetical protein
MPRQPHLFETYHAVILMAQYRAGQAVKQHLRDQGIKVQYVAMAAIKHLARAYLAEHPELIEEAKVICAKLYQRHLVKLAWQRQRRAIQKTLRQAQSKSSTTSMLANAEGGYSTNGR